MVLLCDSSVSRTLAGIVQVYRSGGKFSPFLGWAGHPPALRELESSKKAPSSLLKGNCSPLKAPFTPLKGNRSPLKAPFTSLKGNRSPLKGEVKNLGTDREEFAAESKRLQTPYANNRAPLLGSSGWPGQIRLAALSNHFLRLLFEVMASAATRECGPVSISGKDCE